MTINWIWLLAGLGLGLVPPRWLINCECRYLDFGDFWYKAIRRNPGEGRRRRWWKLPLVWIDPVRGFVTAWLVYGAFTREEGATSAERFFFLALPGALVLLAVAMQTFGAPGSGNHWPLSVFSLAWPCSCFIR